MTLAAIHTDGELGPAFGHGRHLVEVCSPPPSATGKQCERFVWLRPLKRSKVRKVARVFFEAVKVDK